MWTVKIYEAGANVNEPPAHEESRRHFHDAHGLMCEVVSPDVAIRELEMDDFVEYSLRDHQTGKKTGNAVIEREK